MPIVFARVDDRLIHGQIVQAWLPELNVDEILIPRSPKAQGNFNEGLLRLSLPYEYELTVLDAHRCKDYIEHSAKKIFLLAASLADVMPLIEVGLKVKSLNIGGMHFKQGAQKLDDNVFFDEQDKRLLSIFKTLGLNIETRAVPNSKSVSLEAVLP